MSSASDQEVHIKRKFTKLNFSNKTLKERGFVQCVFVGCDFSKTRLRDDDFENCTFEQCNFSMTIMEGAGFRDCIFKGCKILGVDFTTCNRLMFSFSFDDCHLDYCVFVGVRLRNTVFNNCTLKESDFSNADLSSSNFKNSELPGTVFSNSNLEKADFRTARNFDLDLDQNKMKDAKFSSLNLAGLLSKYRLNIDYGDY